MRDSFTKFVAKQRLKPYHLALCVLFVGWAPSFLLAYYSYTVLGRTLEAKSMADSESLVRSLSQHVENELERTGETMDFYRTLPVTANILQPGAVPLPATPAPLPATPLPFAPAPGARGRARANAAATVPANITPPTNPQEWLANIFYPQKRIDGMFLTDATGRLIASLPRPGGNPEEKHADFSADAWKDAAEKPGAQYVVSPVYLRAADARPVASVVVAVRDPAGTLLGFLGSDILVERLGRRLRNVEMLNPIETSVQIVDQDDRSLFTRDLGPNTSGEDGIDHKLLHLLRQQKNGTRESGGRFYIFAAIDNTNWTLVLSRPAAAVHAPVQDVLRETLLLVGILVVGTLFAALLLSRFYRRQLLSSLRVQREQIFNEKILANMPVGIALVDPAGERFLQANSSFSEIVRSLGGLPREWDITKATFAEAAVTSREALARVLHFGVPFQAIEQRTPTASGQVRYLTTNLLRLQDNAQNTMGVLCLVEDSTAAVTLRQELLNANASKDQFLAQLSHELRNPLSPVITMVAELETYTDSLPATRQPLEIIRRNVELEARLIDDLLDVTRISSGKLQLTRKPIDVHRILRLALEICQRDIDDKRLVVRVELAAHEHFAEADPARLQQIFWNLIKNAVKFTPEGRQIIVRSANLSAGQASAGAGKSHVQLPPTSPTASMLETRGGAPVREGGFLRVEVIDEGIGIEGQHLRRIFNAFDQGQSNTTQRFGGLGLGLAISKAMVEAHGGSLKVASEGAGKGATFTVELETCPAPADGGDSTETEPVAVGTQHMPTVGTAAATVGAGRRVLLVDDHLDTCLGMERLLKRRGYRVAVAHSVAEALTRAKEDEAFDLLISDLGLPDGTGFDIMQEIRKQGGPPGIALSGFGMESDIGKSREAGFSEHLIKPVSIDRLDAAMRKLLAPETSGV